MNETINILYACITLGGMGLIFGLLLSVAAKFFAVEQDERIPAILEVLPGANCGGCGYAGCGAFAEAVVGGQAKTNGCPVGRNETAQKIAEIMGLESQEVEKKIARIRCSGTTKAARTKFKYEGISDCVAANKLLGGDKFCPYACLGLGTCARVCPFGAISVQDGVAAVNPKKCAACGKCVETCPKKVIDFTRERKTAWVACNSQNKGAMVKQICDVGCLSCKICEKACPTKAIKVENNLARVNEEMCINCGECAAKCPRGIIIC